MSLSNELGVERSAPAGAVFLSYASQDVEAALRLCSGLRAAGVEVWFDQNELVGGDAWDAKIRKQIKECALFLPIVSASTQARREGYFRLEWKLADDRTHLMAKGMPFLMPVCIDATQDWDALVPDSFMSVQWTRLALTQPNAGPAEEILAKFARRVAQLLAGGATPAAPARARTEAEPSASRVPAQQRTRGWPIALAAAAALTGVSGAVFFALRPAQQTSPAPALRVGTNTETGTAAPSAPNETAQLIARARMFYTKVNYTRADLATAEELARRATEKEPDLAAAWGARAGVQATYLFRNWDLSEKRRQDTEAFASRALGLNPEEPEALLALAHLLRQQGANAQALAHFRRALAADPTNNRIARALGTTLSFEGRHEEGRAVLLEAVKRDPKDALVRYDLALTYDVYIARGARMPTDLGPALEQLNAGLAAQPLGSLLIAKAVVEGGWLGNLPALRTTLAQLERLPLAERADDRAVFIAMWGALLDRDPARVHAAAAITAKNYFEDGVVPHRPRDWGLALAHRLENKENVARLAWQRAETMLRQRLRDEPTNQLHVLDLAITLAWLGRAEEALREIAPVEARAREEVTRGRNRALAYFYGAIGDAGRAVPYLRQSLNQTVFLTSKTLVLDPWWDKLRGQAEFEALLKEEGAKP